MNWILKSWESSVHILVKWLIWQFKKGAKTGNHTIIKEYMSLSLSLFPCVLLFQWRSWSNDDNLEIWQQLSNNGHEWDLRFEKSWLLDYDFHVVEQRPSFETPCKKNLHLWTYLYQNQVQNTFCEVVIKLNLVNNNSLEHFNYLNLAQRHCVRLKWDTSVK